MTLPISVSGTLTGTKNGVNKIFTIASTPLNNTLIVWKNAPGIPFIDYTVSGNVITFTNAPLSTDDLYYQGWI